MFRQRGRSALVFTILLAACRDENLPAAPVPATFVVEPAIAATTPWPGTVRFSAHDFQGAPRNVTWSVNGVPGGNAQLGSISTDGIYTSPATIPAGDSVLVTAVAVEQASDRKSATIFFVPDGTATDYYVVLPRAIDTRNASSLRILVVPPTPTTSVTFLPDEGDAVPLVPIGSNVLTFELSADRALGGYEPGTLHNPVGRLDYRSPLGNRIKLSNFSVNVRDATMPDVPIVALESDAQRSPHVLNIRLDAATSYADNNTATRALQLLGGDNFDFVAIVATVTTTNNRSFRRLSNDVEGIGLSLSGSGRLRGLISFPIDAFFDGAEQGMLHEIGHSWINFANDQALGSGSPHWPPSTMASGTMGFNIPGSGAGGTFSWALSALGNGTVLINSAVPSDRFTPIDLYLMGMLPADSVPPMLVLPSTANPNQFTDGMTMTATTYTIGDYIAVHGPREPSSATSRRNFSAAVVVLTYGRLLTPSEMAFFDHASARAETRTALPSQTGLSRTQSSGFFLATGGRATLRTRLP